MAVADYHFRNVILHYIIPIVLLAVLLIIMSKHIRKLAQRFIAWFQSTIVLDKLHAILSKEKWELFKEMETKGPLNILELGAGSGVNFKLYPEGSTVTCLEPNGYYQQYLYENHMSLNPKIKLKEFVCGYGEDMSQFSEGEFDMVVETLTLCTVNDVEKVLREVKRVLKPGGKFYFLDHVAAKQKTTLRFAQERLNILWKILVDNCHINRNISHYIKKAGFSEVEITEFKMNTKMSLIRPCIYGTATK